MKDDIGLTRGTVRVVSYKPQWEALFAEEKNRLHQALGSQVHDIEHIGSTAVPGLAAKPIIDMIAVVDNLDIYKQLIQPLTKLGYEFMPERVFEDRVFFPKGPRSKRTHHLSLVVKDSKAWNYPIQFRDYLISNPNARQAYQQLKEELATKHVNDRAGYTAAKSQFIEITLHSSTATY